MNEIPNHDRILLSELMRRQPTEEEWSGWLEAKRDMAEEERRTHEDEMNEADDECRPESWED